MARRGVWQRPIVTTTVLCLLLATTCLGETSHGNWEQGEVNNILSALLRSPFKSVAS